MFQELTDFIEKNNIVIYKNTFVLSPKDEFSIFDSDINLQFFVEMLKKYSCNVDVYTYYERMKTVTTIKPEFENSFEELKDIETQMCNLHVKFEKLMGYTPYENIFTYDPKEEWLTKTNVVEKITLEKPKITFICNDENILSYFNHISIKKSMGGRL